MGLDFDIALKLLGLLLIVPGTLLSRAKLRLMRYEQLKLELDILEKVDPSSDESALVKERAYRSIREVFRRSELVPSLVLIQNQLKRRVNPEPPLSEGEYVGTLLFLLVGATGFSYWTYVLTIADSSWGFLTGALALLFYKFLLSWPGNIPR